MDFVKNVVNRVFGTVDGAVNVTETQRAWRDTHVKWAAVNWADVDWTKSVVGGSFARYWLTCDEQMAPRDIDIFIGCRTKQEFLQEARRLGATDADETKDAPEDKYTTLGIFGVYTLLGNRNGEPSNLPVQLIGLELRDGQSDVTEALAARTDAVGGIFVRYLPDGQLAFTVLSRALGTSGACVINKSFAPASTGTMSRQFSYQHKGFTFI